MTDWHWALWWSDWLFLALLLLSILAVIFCYRQPHLRRNWKKVAASPVGMVTAIIVISYLAVALLDSLHGRYSSQVNTVSVLDVMMGDLAASSERSYSAPFAKKSFTSHLQTSNGGMKRVYRDLDYPARHPWQWSHFVLMLFFSIVIMTLVMWLWLGLLAYRRKIGICAMYRRLWRGQTSLAWREAFATVKCLWLLMTIFVLASQSFHVFGTDKIGRDVFYMTLKSVRTGVLIGTLTTLFMLPFALFLGSVAGYFQGWVDDVVQYIYTTLSSIPGVLLISASILVLQVYIANHPEWFNELSQRADARLIALCLILGVTSWTSLCRLLRAETLKLRRLEYVQAARVMRVSAARILWRHIIPNTLHIVMITLVLDFSGLVLAEAVLSYVGIGVDPTTFSWGHMINSSRLELARSPMVWWPLAASVSAMFVLVLSANLLADRVRDAFDPRQS
jgi:peptide/nickel transport system permease protein